MIDYNLEKIEWAYIRFKQFADNLNYRKQENTSTKKDAIGKEYKETTYDIRANSRVIISNLKDETDCDCILERLNNSSAPILNEEYLKFKDSI